MWSYWILHSLFINVWFSALICCWIPVFVVVKPSLAWLPGFTGESCVFSFLNPLRPSLPTHHLPPRSVSVFMNPQLLQCLFYLHCGTQGSPSSRLCCLPPLTGIIFLPQNLNEPAASVPDSMLDLLFRHLYKEERLHKGWARTWWTGGRLLHQVQLHVSAALHLQTLSWFPSDSRCDV